MGARLGAFYLKAPKSLKPDLITSNTSRKHKDCGNAILDDLENQRLLVRFATNSDLTALKEEL